MSYNNNHNNDDKKKNKKSLYQFLDKEGFYIVLFLCVCIVAVTAIWVSNQEQDPIVGENPSQQEEDSSDVTLVEDTTTGEEEASETVVIPKTNKAQTDKTTTAVKEEETPKPEKTDEVEEQEQETVAETKALQVMMMPVLGRYGLGYADDRLVYHKTLNQWSTHRGVDIHAEEGAPVRAALEGEVLEVINDTVMGITITLQHDDELLTRYSNLSTDAMVKVGDLIEKGQIISGVGTTASVKAEEGPLLHFQVIKDGRVVNPSAYLPKNN